MISGETLWCLGHTKPKSSVGKRKAKRQRQIREWQQKTVSSTPEKELSSKFSFFKISRDCFQDAFGSQGGLWGKAVSLLNSAGQIPRASGVHSTGWKRFAPSLPFFSRGSKQVAGSQIGKVTSLRCPLSWRQILRVSFSESARMPQSPRKKCAHMQMIRPGLSDWPGILWPLVEQCDSGYWEGCGLIEKLPGKPGSSERWCKPAASLSLSSFESYTL